MNDQDLIPPPYEAVDSPHNDSNNNNNTVHNDSDSIRNDSDNTSNTTSTQSNEPNKRILDHARKTFDITLNTGSIPSRGHVDVVIPAADLAVLAGVAHPIMLNLHTIEFNDMPDYIKDLTLTVGYYGDDDTFVPLNTDDVSIHYYPSEPIKITYNTGVGSIRGISIPGPGSLLDRNITALRRVLRWRTTLDPIPATGPIELLTDTSVTSRDICLRTLQIDENIHKAYRTKLRPTTDMRDMVLRFHNLDRYVELRSIGMTFYRIPVLETPLTVDMAKALEEAADCETQSPQ